MIYNYGLWDCQSDYIFKDDGGYNGTVFNNYGTFRKSAGTSTSQTFDRRRGFLQSVERRGGRAGGRIWCCRAAAISPAARRTNNNGELVFSVGNFNLNGTQTGTNVIENSGNLVGANVINGCLNWQAGSWQGANSVTIATNSTVLMAAGGGNMYMYNCTVTNYGTFAWSSGYPDGGGTPATLIYNYGLWDCQSDYNFKDDRRLRGTVFNNYGTFRKSAGANASQTLIANGVLFNQLSGVVDVQTGRICVLSGGGNFTGGSVTNEQRGCSFSAPAVSISTAR